jgi:hypothetical protein
VGALLTERLRFYLRIQAALYTVDRWCTDHVAVLHVTDICSVNGVSHVTQLSGAALTLYMLNTPPRLVHGGAR